MQVLLKKFSNFVTSLFFLFSILISGHSLAADFIYIVNENGTVSVFDATTYMPILGSPFTSIPGYTANAQVWISISPNGTRAYVPGWIASNTVAVFDIDPSTGALTLVGGTPVPVPDAPFAAAVSPDGNYVYITHFGSNYVTIHDKDLNLLGSVTTPISPAAIQVSPLGDRVYLCHAGANQVTTFETSTVAPYLINPVTVSSGGTTPYFLNVNPSGSHVYVTNFGSNTITRYNPDLSGAFTEVPATTGLSGPIGIAFEPQDESRVYVSNQTGSHVSILDALTFVPITTIPPSGGNTYFLAINPLGTQLFVAYRGSSQFGVYDVVHDTYPQIAGSPFPVSMPYGIAFTPHALPTTPQNLRGVQKKNNAGVQCEYYILLQWNAPEQGSPTGYNVYREGVKIATVSGTTFQYEDHNRVKGFPTDYSVNAIYANSVESEPITIEVNH